MANKIYKALSLLFIMCLLICMAGLLTGCWIKIIDTPYYSQETGYFGGAAAAQMILSSQNINLNPPPQNTLYNYIHSHNQCERWGSDPKGLRDVLNFYHPAGHYIYYTSGNQTDGNKKIAYTVDRYGVPAAVLINGGARWVVVFGAVTDKQPTSNASFEVSHFFVHDPSATQDSLGAHHLVEINTWNNYFTGAEWRPVPGTTYISVVDPRPVPKINITYSKPLARRETIIPPAEIQNMAKQYFSEVKQKKDLAGKFKIDSKIIDTAKITAPVLVTRSDKANEAYYIAPLLQGDLTAGAILVDAYSGQFMDATFTPRAINYTPILNQATAIQLFKNSIPNMKLTPWVIKALKLNPKAEVQLKPKEVTITKITRTWEPSQQTQNPYYPLWQIEGKVRRMKTAKILGYMDNYGAIYPSIAKLDIKLNGGAGQ